MAIFGTQQGFMCIQLPKISLIVLNSMIYITFKDSIVQEVLNLKSSFLNLWSRVIFTQRITPCISPLSLEVMYCMVAHTCCVVRDGLEIQHIFFVSKDNYFLSENPRLLCTSDMSNTTESMRSFGATCSLIEHQACGC